MSRPAAWHDRAGATAVEYAIIVPVFLLFIIGLMDVGRLMWTYAALTRATDAAARCAAINTTSCATAAQVQSYAVNQAWGLRINPNAFTLASVACGKQVTGNFTFVFAIPVFETQTPLGSISLTAKACYPA